MGGAIVILTTATIVFLTWFRDGSIIYFWDGTFPIDPALAIYKYSFIWHDFNGFGSADITGVKLIPYFSILALFHHILGLPMELSQSILYYMLFAGSGLSFFYLIKSLFSANKTSTMTMVAVAGALFYMFNMYAMLFLWRIFSTNLFLYATLPVIAILSIRILNSNKISFFNLILLFATFIIASPAHPSILVLLFITVIAGISTKIILGAKQTRKKFATNGIILISVMFAANVYWLLPVLAGTGTSIVLSSPYGGTDSALAFNSKYADLWQVLQLKGQQILYEQYQGEYDYPWITQYHAEQHSFINSLSILITIVVFVSVLDIRHSRKIVLSFLAMLIFLFFTKGTNEPWGAFYEFLFSEIPGFTAFRDPYSKFGFFYTFFLAILYSIGLRTITRRFQIVNNGHKIILIRSLPFATVLVLTILVSGLYMWPMWLGEHIPEGTEIRPSARVIVPNEYLELSEFIKKENEGRFLELPFQDRPLQSVYLKSGYVGFPILQYMSFQSIVSGIVGTEPQDTLSRQIMNIIESDNPSFDKSGFLSALGIKYIILHEDSNTKFDPLQNSPEDIREILSRTDGISFYKQFGEASVWKISREIRPLVYGIMKDASARSSSTIIDAPEVAFGSGNVEVNNDKYILTCKTAKETDYCDFAFSPTIPKYNQFLLNSTETSHDTLVSLSYVDSFGNGQWPKALNSPQDQLNDNVYHLPNPYNLRYEINPLYSDYNPTLFVHLNQKEPNDSQKVLELIISKESFFINDESDYPFTYISDYRFQPVKFEKISSTEYKIYVDNRTPFADVLVFVQTYDPSWVASVNGVNLEHSNIFGYFNGYSTESIVEGSIITLEYKPQLFYSIGSSLTAICFAVLIALLAITKGKSIKHLDFVGKFKDIRSSMKF